MAEETAKLPNRILVVILILLAVALGGLGFLGWQYWQLSQKVQVPEPAPASEITPTANPTPTTATKGDLELITEAMAARHSKSVSEVNLTMNQNTGTHAGGSVSFSGEMGGGWWFAAKTESGWVIAADGNGTVPCADIEPYNFPTLLIPECWNETTSTLITR